ncbi:MAG: 50S ribosomal protein L25/general stress protein Ctc [Rickettsiales bacterium]|jgi:large subunit ribosomal protein L25|nr:50S ribosomal protein L25/general stress protein Ctc [Rickettsiales bacterium]
MAKKVSLPVLKRERRGKGAARETRRRGLIPGVIYGNKQPPELISISPRELQKQLSVKGIRTRQFELDCDGAKTMAMLHDIQFDRVKDAPLCVDFLRLDLKKEMTVEIPFRFVGEDRSEGLKSGGALNIVEREAAVVCLPSDLVDDIEIDVSALGIGDSIHSSEVRLPKGLHFESHDEFTIVTVAAPMADEPEAAGGDAAVPTEGDLKKEAEGKVAAASGGKAEPSKK